MRAVLFCTVLHVATAMVLGSPIIEIYSTPGCRYCAKAKGFFRGRGVAFAEIDVAEDEHDRHAEDEQEEAREHGREHGVAGHDAADDAEQGQVV